MPPPPRPAPQGPAPQGPPPEQHSEPTQRAPEPSRYQPPQAWSAAPPAAPPGKPASPTPSVRPAGRSTPPPASPPPASPTPAPAKKPLITGKYAPTQTPEPIPVDPRRASARPVAPPAQGPSRRGPSPNVTPAKRRGPAKPPAAPKQTKPKRARTKKRRLTFRRLTSLLMVLLLVVVGSAIGGMVYYDGKLKRVNALSFSGRISQTPGTNWLVVGTDSREGMTAAERKRLSTGPDEGGIRTDTIMLIAKPVKGPTAIISIPRDLFVEIPGGNGQHKINAAYSMGGPKLLVQTIESVAGIHIDHYAEIGFGGFADIVDSIGGVKVCLKESMRDRKAGLRLKAGCQKVNGKQALGLVRSRDFPNADLVRVVNQRKVFVALVDKAASPGVVLNPFRLIPFIDGTISALTVDKGDHTWDLARLAWSLRGSPLMVTVPTGGSVWSYDGDALAVDDDTEAFFARIAKGKGVDRSSIDDNDGGAIK
ncbi:MAG: LCP family protein [Gordonia sp. (in: high G+C Gram-positive bacteria)]